MDRREDADTYTYQKELEKERAETKEYNEYVEENGLKYRVPFHTVRQIVFTDVKKEELIDTEHAARLQYRLMLQEAVLFAKVEFVARKISITYNPTGADNRKAQMSRQDVVDFLAKQGVHVGTNPESVSERDVDYYNEHYKYHYNPPSIREHPPYGYTLDEWRNGMKAEYETHKAAYDKAKLDKYHEFQNNYLREHPELAAEMGVKVQEPKEEKGILGKILKKKAKKDEKGFWFHGV